MIDIREVTKVFGAGSDAFRALDRVSVTIRQNEFFTLLGPSGCGKTTLLRMIAGFEGPTEGTILLDGDDLAGKPPYERPVNTVFQSYALFPHMSVAENVGFGLRMLGRPKDEIAATVREMLALVRMSELAERQTAQISGGQQQRVALARALAPRPKVLLLDEPLSALDFKLRKEMQLELKRLQNETGITFVFVTHDQEEALTMSDRIAVMNAGRIRQIGVPREIYDHPADRFVADFIGDTNFLSAELTARTGDTATLRLPSGRTVEARAQGDGTPGKVTLAVRPEHAELAPPEEGALTGTLTEVVYSGTDTHYHVALDQEAGLFVLRRQNRPDAGPAHQRGDRVGIRLGAVAGQVLRD
ncbi:ABC transporter ATP-binding protein [Roseivivax isoporae]|uniref:Spermidine/putrescine import ATP-binding protein PotA n=1 Tax=Roseivivax isoporae LMG 25204 TaxID=1449351 RepID=X7FAJ0_9RHOB|nr:ABC transporter ATP-binding protein [Roseivivax isoporae]ETX29738.1 spermidine/putrescine ABC transporter ATP-binding protein [Roseivivax isoporae LMG 25204]